VHCELLASVQVTAEIQLGMGLHAAQVSAVPSTT